VSNGTRMIKGGKDVKSIGLEEKTNILAVLHVSRPVVTTSHSCYEYCIILYVL
jgi:hypothetical protein